MIVQSAFLSNARLLGAALFAAGLLMVARAEPAAAASADSTPHPSASAASTSAAQLRVENAWVRQPPPGAEVAAAYFTLFNAGRKPAVLVGIDCPLAAMAMLHRTSVVAGESRMRMVDQLTIPPRSAVTLEPGGLHVMLHQLTGALAVGQHVPLVLHFASGKELHVEAKVRPLGSR